MLPHREKYVTYSELTDILQGFQTANPELVALESIGKSGEGRDLWVLVIGKDRDRKRPAAWVDGNMHATEVCGSSVALGIAEDLLTLHRTGKIFDLPPHVCDQLREVLFYIMPRMSPDGAETVLTQGRYVRSVPRDSRHHAPTPRWIAGDVDGDGLALVMRKEDPTGEFVTSSVEPNVLLPRTLESVGPFYKVYPEGFIENFEGVVPDPFYLSDNDADLNRNFPYAWMPEPEQAGAGRYPTSEPESRAVVEYTQARPHIFAWLNLHTFGGVYIRPLGTAADNKMDSRDLALFHQIAEWGEKYGGYPTVSGYEEFTYEPDKPLHGDLTEFAYHQLGAIAYVCELWDLFTVIGAKKGKKFVDYYSHVTVDDLHRFAKWDREVNHGRVFLPWRKTSHPQLGEVEVGGFDMRVGMSNPPLEAIDATCTRQSQAFLRVAAMAPRVSVRHVATKAVASGAHEVEIEASNTGYLPTFVLSSAKKLSLDARIFVEVTGERGLEVIGDKRVCLEHLDGWGRGLFDQSIFLVRSRGSVSSKRARFVVKGAGALVVRVHGQRTGEVSAVIEIG
jgi:hypothetical protein